MSVNQVSKGNSMLTFLGSLGAFLIFSLILFIAYLPHRPAPVDAQVVATRQAKADEARAAGIQKLTSFEVLNAEAGIARIPIEDAMLLTVASYQSEPTVEELAEISESVLPAEASASTVAPASIDVLVAEEAPTSIRKAAEVSAHDAE
jgi:hypothetical protein